MKKEPRIPPGDRKIFAVMREYESRRQTEIQETARRIQALHEKIGDMSSIAPRLGALGIALNDLNAAIIKLSSSIEKIYLRPSRKWWLW
jgi:hypothetical protein